MDAMILKAAAAFALACVSIASAQVPRNIDAEIRSALVTKSAAGFEFLGTLGVLPDSRVLELAQDFRQTFVLGFVVKGTP